MDVSPYITPLGDPTSVQEYLVRIWVPGASGHEAWQVADWLLSDVRTVEDAIAWARETANGRPCEVLIASEQQGPLRVWGAEPDDASATFDLSLRGDLDHD